jgi:hypothetical protein
LRREILDLKRVLAEKTLEADFSDVPCKIEVQAPSLPQAHPCWRINEMGQEENECGKLWESNLSHVKGSIIRMLRGVAMNFVSMEGVTPLDCRQKCGGENL